MIDTAAPDQNKLKMQQYIIFRPKLLKFCIDALKYKNNIFFLITL